MRYSADSGDQSFSCGRSYDIFSIRQYFNENNIDCEIIVPENATETFDAPNHSREEYKVLAKKMLQLNGIKVPQKYER